MKTNPAGRRRVSPFAKIPEWGRVDISLERREAAALQYFCDRWFSDKNVGISGTLSAVVRMALLNPEAIIAKAQKVYAYCRAEGIENQEEFILASIATRKEYRRAAKRLEKVLGV